MASLPYSDIPQELPNFHQLFIDELEKLSIYNHGLIETTKALVKLQNSSKESLKLPIRMSFNEVLKSTVVEMELATAKGEVEKNQEMVNQAIERLNNMLSEAAKERLKTRESYVTIEEHSTQHWTLYLLFGKYQVLRTESANEIPSRIAEIFKQAGSSMGLMVY